MQFLQKRDHVGERFRRFHNHGPLQLIRLLRQQPFGRQYFLDALRIHGGGFTAAAAASRCKCHVRLKAVTVAGPGHGVDITAATSFLALTLFTRHVRLNVCLFTLLPPSASRFCRRGVRTGLTQDKTAKWKKRKFCIFENVQLGDAALVSFVFILTNAVCNMLYTMFVLFAYNCVLLTALTTVYGGTKASPDVLFRLYQTRGWAKYGFVLLYFTLHGAATLLATIGSAAKTADGFLSSGILFAAGGVAKLFGPKPSQVSSSFSFARPSPSPSPPLSPPPPPPPPSQMSKSTTMVPRTRKRIAAPIKNVAFTEPGPYWTQPPAAAGSPALGSCDSDGTHSRSGSPQTRIAASNSSTAAS